MHVAERMGADSEAGQTEAEILTLILLSCVIKKLSLPMLFTLLIHKNVKTYLPRIVG